MMTKYIQSIFDKCDEMTPELTAIYYILKEIIASRRSGYVEKIPKSLL
jgi:hypothetical protein